MGCIVTLPQRHSHPEGGIVIFHQVEDEDTTVSTSTSTTVLGKRGLQSGVHGTTFICATDVLKKLKSELVATVGSGYYSKI